MSGCHVDTMLINMHETLKVSAEGQGNTLRTTVGGEGYLPRPLSLKIMLPKGQQSVKS